LYENGADRPLATIRSLDAATGGCLSRGVRQIRPGSRVAVTGMSHLGNVMGIAHALVPGTSDWQVQLDGDDWSRSIPGEHLELHSGNRYQRQWLHGLYVDVEKSGHVEIVAVSEDAIRPTVTTKFNVLLSITLLLLNPFLKINATWGFYQGGDVGFAAVSFAAVLVSLAVMFVILERGLAANRANPTGYLKNQTRKEFFQLMLENDLKSVDLGKHFANLKSSLVPETQVSMFIIPYGMLVKTKYELSITTVIMLLSIILGARTSRWQSDEWEENFAQMHRKMIIKTLPGGFLRGVITTAGQMCGCSGGVCYPLAMLPSPMPEKGDTIRSIADGRLHRVLDVSSQNAYQLVREDAVVSSHVPPSYVTYVTTDGSNHFRKCLRSISSMPWRFGGLTFTAVVAVPLHHQLKDNWQLRWAAVTAFLVLGQMIRTVFLRLADLSAQLASGVRLHGVNPSHMCPWYFKRSSIGPYLHLFRLAATVAWQACMITLAWVVMAKASSDTITWANVVSKITPNVLHKLVAGLVLLSCPMFGVLKLLAIIIAQFSDWYHGMSFRSPEWPVQHANLWEPYRSEARVKSSVFTASKASSEEADLQSQEDS